MNEFSRVTARLAAAPRDRANRASRGLTIAVVGCGYWGAKHVRILTTLARVGQVVVVDPSLRARSAIASTFPGVETATNLSSVLDRVHAVVVATPPRDHSDVALAAVRAGKHVLIEKPMATSLAEARILVDEAARHEVTLMVGHTFEFNPAVRELRRRMDAGELGDIHYIHSARLNLGLYRTDVNVVWDLAPHDVSIMNYLLRSTPTRVSAWASAHASPGVPDLAYFQLEFPERGVMGYGHVCWLDPRKVRQVTVVGSRKMAVYDDLAEERLRIFDRGIADGRSGDGSQIHSLPVTYRYGDIVSPHIVFQEPLMLEDQHFVDSIFNRTAPLSDGVSGLAVTSVLEAIDRALATGSRTDVEPRNGNEVAPTSLEPARVPALVTG